MRPIEKRIVALEARVRPRDQLNLPVFICRYGADFEAFKRRSLAEVEPDAKVIFVQFMSPEDVRRERGLPAGVTTH